MTADLLTLPVEITPRDVALLRGLYESRICTIAHAAKLYFGGSVEAAKKRVGKLKRAGLIAERPRRAYHPSVLFIARRGFLLMHERKYAEGYPPLTWGQFEKRARVAEATLKHELAVLDVKTALTAGIEAVPGLTLEEFGTWPVMYEFTARPHDGAPLMAVKPDGFIRVRQKSADGELSEHCFYLEVDRSSETQDTLGVRAECYRDHYRRGGLAERFGMEATQFEAVPFRVLIVTNNEERRNNTARRLLHSHPPILSQTWLTTLPEFKSQPLEAIWVRPMDYRDAARGTAFDVYQERPAATYRRQTEREAFIERAIERHRLF